MQHDLTLAGYKVGLNCKELSRLRCMGENAAMVVTDERLMRSYDYRTDDKKTVLHLLVMKGFSNWRAVQ